MQTAVPAWQCCSRPSPLLKQAVSHTALERDGNDPDNVCSKPGLATKEHVYANIKRAVGLHM